MTSEWEKVLCMVLPRIQTKVSPYATLLLSMTSQELRQQYRSLAKTNYFKFGCQPTITELEVLFHFKQDHQKQLEDNEEATKKLLTVDLDQHLLELHQFLSIDSHITIQNGNIKCNGRSIQIFDKDVKFNNINFTGVVMFELHGNSKVDFKNCQFDELYLHPEDESIVYVNECEIRSKLFVMTVHQSAAIIRYSIINISNDNFMIQASDESSFEMAHCSVEMKNNSLIGMVCRFAGKDVEIIQNEFRYSGGWGFEFVSDVWQQNSWQRFSRN
eukprot:TRINITY_DN10391_c1_g2_i1.p1 TRINITY_DN10391_c1_g2~~TRINITY_DN10391_c1_g2_i1.p1  ORF type:complete len:272 (+),score=21.57 TRINITY_DN10391_c1_g2_i1:38-853(+)